MDHTFYDKRHYPIVDVLEGYGEWVDTYEQTVQDEMDLRLLEGLTTVDWQNAMRVLDLACGTGRVGAWLTKRLPNATIDGIDITPQMLAVARSRDVYASLRIADITDTGLHADSYDLCTQSLADEHLSELATLYREVARVTRPGGRFVLVGYHPHFLISGIPTHFDSASGQPITIRSYVHLLSDHVRAAHASGWSLREMNERLIDEAWLQKKPKFRKYEGLPISFVFVWQKSTKHGTENQGIG